MENTEDRQVMKDLEQNYGRGGLISFKSGVLHDNSTKLMARKSVE